jgi:hypothetical protein
MSTNYPFDRSKLPYDADEEEDWENETSDPLDETASEDILMLLDEAEDTSTSTPEPFANTSVQAAGMSRQAVDHRRRKRALYERRRKQLDNTLLALALRDRDEAFKNKVYEIVIQTGLDPEDPAFLLMVATGRLELMLEESPKELEASFDQWSQRIYTQLQHYREGLEHYERTAIKAQEKAISQSVHALIRKTAIDKLVHSFSAASIVIGGTFLLVAGIAGAVLGSTWTTWRQAQIEYAPGEPRQLTLNEAKALEWATSSEGQFARNLMEWNQSLLIRNSQGKLLCEQDAERLGVTLELEGRKASGGFCTLWTRPLGDRQFESQ